jgi:outer membrane lipoprotein-sorting protein
MRTIVIVMAWAIVSVAQRSVAPSANEIVSRMVARNEARATALHKYESTRTYRVSYKGFPKNLYAKAVVRLDFKAPDQKQFTIVSQEGSTLLVNRVIRKALESETEAAKPEFRNRSALDESNYDFKLLGKDSVAGRPCYLLAVTPKREDKYLYDGEVCVDAADYAAVRIESKPAKNPSFWISRAHIESQNQKIGEFWLPLYLRSTSHVRLGGDAELDIDYGDYKITSAASVKAQAPAH